MIMQALADQPLPIYGDGQNVSDWIHVEDHCRAIDLIIQHGREGEVYNIGGECQQRNLDVAHMILENLGKPRCMIQFVLDRPGHDLRYAINRTKLKTELGWQPRWRFPSGPRETIRWYQENDEWLNEIRLKNITEGDTKFLLKRCNFGPKRRWEIAERCAG